jgi:hypothetical protein
MCIKCEAFLTVKHSYCGAGVVTPRSLVDKCRLFGGTLALVLRSGRCGSMFSRSTGSHFTRQYVHITSQDGFKLRCRHVYYVLSLYKSVTWLPNFIRVRRVSCFNRLTTCIGGRSWGRTVVRPPPGGRVQEAAK